MSIEAMKQALKKAFSLGQTYWQQADSEYSSHHKKADETRARFDQLIEETCQAIAEAEKQEPVRIMGFNCVCGRRMVVSAEQGVVPAPHRQPQYDKTEMNAFVQNLYDQKMREGKHGHYETMFHVVHKAIEQAHGIKGE